MKISVTLNNPAPYQQVIKALKAAEQAGLKSAAVSFRTWDDRDYTGDLNGHKVEISIEGRTE